MRITIALAVACLTITGLSVAAESGAAIKRYDLNIPRQSLDSALKDLAQQTGLQVGRFSDAVKGDTVVGPVTGQYTAPLALEALLESSGLTYRSLNDRAVIVLRPEDAAQLSSSAQGEEAGLARLAQSEKSGNSDNPGNKAATETSPSASSKEEGVLKIQEIIVTATKRKERLQDVPLSITAITADDIDRRGLVNAEDYLRGIPGVNQTPNSLAGQTIVIRGLETSNANQNFYSGATTATYFGETPTTSTQGLAGGTSTDVKLVDIERVEVLRGPQGTAFGSAALAGLVRTIPTAPKLDRVEGKVGASYSATSGSGGDNNSVQAVLNLPLIADRLALRAVGYRFEDSGFYRNRAGSDANFQSTFAVPNSMQAFATDENEVGTSTTTGARLAALLRVNDQLTFTLSYLTQKNELDGWPGTNVGDGYGQTLLQVAPETAERGQTGGFTDTGIDIANAVIQYDFGRADLLATYSYTSGRLSDSLPLNGLVGLGVPLPPITYPAQSDQQARSAEVRLTTRLEGRWNFLAGLYYENLDDAAAWHPLRQTAAGQVNFGDYFNGRELTQKAAFGEVSWEFLPRLTLTAGARYYDYERKQLLATSGAFFGSFGPASTDADASGTSLRGNLSYKIHDGALIYAAWSQGFRLGAAQAGLNPTTCDRNGDGFVDGTQYTIEATKIVGSDKADNFELGAKLSLLDRRLSITADVFQIDWSDVPLTISAQALGAGGCIPPSFTANVGDVRSTGLEVEASYRISESWQVDAGTSYTHARLSKDLTSLVPPVTKGSRLPGSPKYNASLGLQHGFKIGNYDAFVRADSIYVGHFFADLYERPSGEGGGYVKLDASARVTLKSLDIDLFARNLTNADEFSVRNASAISQRLRPRTIGVQLGYRF